MALTPIDEVFIKKTPPPPVHESIVGGGNKATTAFIRYLTDVQKADGNIFTEINKVIAQVNLNIVEINSLQVELDNTQGGAGLDTDGNYIPFIGSNYIDTAISLSDADDLLDKAIFDNSRELIIEVTATTALNAENQLILCDATSEEIDITLPDPSLSFADSRSFKIGITKVDTSVNAVNILPFASELIVGETSQYLVLDGEVLNFITDGTNWYLEN